MPMGIGIGIGLGRGQGGGVTYAAESLLIFAAFTTPPSTARKALIDACVVSLKTAGVWAKGDKLGVEAAADAQAALINWINPGTFDSVAVNSPAFAADRGYTSDGVSAYVDTNFNPATAAGKFVRNSACFGIWSRTSTAAPGATAGFYDGSFGVTLLPRFAGDITEVRINQGAVPTVAASTDGSGLFVGNRSGANAVQTYRNGAALPPSSGDTVVSVAMVSNNLYLGRATSTAYRAMQFAAHWCGQSLDATEQAALYSALNTYMVGVGAA